MEGKEIKKLTPSNKDVVNLLCKFLRNETKKVTDKNNVSKLVNHIVLECPNPYCRLEKKEMSFQKGKGYTNPFNHLKTCLCHGKAANLIIIMAKGKNCIRMRVTQSFSIENRVLS